MTTTTVVLDLACPDWCTISADEHAAVLWDLGGTCIHWAPWAVVLDPAGHRAPLEAPQPHEPVEIGLSTCTRPDGIEAESPIVRVNGAELSIAQALALADTLRSVVEQYRAEGGVE